MLPKTPAVTTVRPGQASGRTPLPPSVPGIHHSPQSVPSVAKAGRSGRLGSLSATAEWKTHSNCSFTGFSTQNAFWVGWGVWQCSVSKQWFLLFRNCSLGTAFFVELLISILTQVRLIIIILNSLYWKLTSSTDYQFSLFHLNLPEVFGNANHSNCSLGNQSNCGFETAFWVGLPLSRRCAKHPLD